MKSYETSRKYLGFLEFIGWIVILAGIILFFFGLSEFDNGYLLGFAMAINAMFFGFLVSFLACLVLSVSKSLAPLWTVQSIRVRC